MSPLELRRLWYLDGRKIALWSEPSRPPLLAFNLPGMKLRELLPATRLTSPQHPVYNPAPI